MWLSQSLMTDWSPTVVGCLGVNRRVMILRRPDRRLVFGRPVDLCDVLMVILRYWNRSLLPQDVCQGSKIKRKSHTFKIIILIIVYTERFFQHPFLFNLFGSLSNP